MFSVARDLTLEIIFQVWWCSLLFCPDTVYRPLSMELCTSSVSGSVQWSRISAFDCRTRSHGYASSSSWVCQRRRKTSFYVMNAASTGALPPTKKLIPRTNVRNISGDKPSSALEQLDIERGVCIPFRKYTPEMVLNTSNGYIYRVSFLKSVVNMLISKLLGQK